MDYLPIEKLTPRGIYRLKARNLSYGVWNGEKFVGLRDKFGFRLDACEVPYYTAFPLEFVGMLPEGLSTVECWAPVDEETGRDVGFDRPIAEGGRGWFFVDTNEANVNIQPRGYQNQPLFDYLVKFEMEKGTITQARLDRFKHEED
jgi:hypothetical protein